VTVVKWASHVASYVARDQIDLGKVVPRDEQVLQRRKSPLRCDAIIAGDDSVADEGRGLGLIDQGADCVQDFVHRQPHDALVGDDQSHVRVARAGGPYPGGAAGPRVAPAAAARHGDAPRSARHAAAAATSHGEQA